MEKLHLADVATEEIQQQLGCIAVDKIYQLQLEPDYINTVNWDDSSGSSIFKGLSEQITEQQFFDQLANNTSLFDEKVEDIIDTDPVIMTLLERRKNDESNKTTYTIAIRVRRAIIAAHLQS